MCQKCHEALMKHFPDISDADGGRLLMSCTAFPFADPEQLEVQLGEIAERRRAGGNQANWLEAECAFADSCMESAMAERSENP